jgi:hypothetical protein
LNISSNRDVVEQRNLLAIHESNKDDNSKKLVAREIQELESSIQRLKKRKKQLQKDIETSKVSKATYYTTHLLIKSNSNSSTTSLHQSGGGSSSSSYIGSPLNSSSTARLADLFTR